MEMEKEKAREQGRADRRVGAADDGGVAGGGIRHVGGTGNWQDGMTGYPSYR